MKPSWSARDINTYYSDCVVNFEGRAVAIRRMERDFAPKGGKVPAIVVKDGTLVEIPGEVFNDLAFLGSPPLGWRTLSSDYCGMAVLLHRNKQLQQFKKGLLLDALKIVVPPSYSRMLPRDERELFPVLTEVLFTPKYTASFKEAVDSIVSGNAVGLALSSEIAVVCSQLEQYPIGVWLNSEEINSFDPDTQRWLYPIKKGSVEESLLL